MPLPPKNKLESSLGHFNYEVQELAFCKCFFKVAYPEQQRQAYLNRDLEHIVLHSRNIYEFFYKQTHPNGYVESSNPKANMYVKWEAPPFDDVITAGFEAKASDQINHLGINRTEDSKEKFTVSETIKIANKLLNLTKEFLSKLEEVEGGYYFDKVKVLIGLKRDIDALIKL
ncbi:MAG: hypothetical protein KGH58_02575 [Candidatus Micrarchaeota archaeon]|nr:hypothetical protein [Candidatus Micrarchaeota archaeon]